MPRAARISIAAVASAAVLTVSVAGSALAATDDVDGGNMSWFLVDDAEPVIADAQSAYPDFLGTGTDLAYGWTADAFDDIFYGAEVDGNWIAWSPVAGGAGWVDGGLSSFRYEGIAPGFDADFRIAATLEIQGNYARWTFEPVSGPEGTLSMMGNIGSDGEQTTTIVTPNAAVVSSDDNTADPVIGYWLSGESATLEVPSGLDDIVWAASTSGTATFVVALQDYAPCAEATAVAEMISRVATLDAGFGQAIPGSLECAEVAVPDELSVDEAASQSLAVTVDPLVDAWLADPWQMTTRGAYLSDPTVVESAFVGAPDGLTFAFDPASSEVTFTGTPTAAGSYDVTLALYLTNVEDYWNETLGTGHPLTATFTVVVAGNEVAAPELPPTGSESASWLLIGAATILTGVVVLVGVVRRRTV